MNQNTHHNNNDNTGADNNWTSPFPVDENVGIENAIAFKTNQFPLNLRPILPNLEYLGDRTNQAFYRDLEQQQIFDENKEYIIELIQQLTTDDYDKLKQIRTILLSDD